MKLRGRFAAAAGILVLTVVAGVMTSVYFWERQYLGQSLRSECDSSAARLSRVAEEALSASNDVLWLNSSGGNVGIGTTGPVALNKALKDQQIEIEGLRKELRGLRAK